MIDIKTYQDLLAVANEQEKRQFLLDAISEHKASKCYKEAIDGREYGRKKNVTILEFQKMIHKVTGESVPDSYTANHKTVCCFFPRFVTQLTSYLLRNGVSFTQETTKDKLGTMFDTNLYSNVKRALEQGVVFGLYELDKITYFTLLDFVPLYDEENNSLRAGIRFWQISDDKPLRMTLYEEDGYTDYIKTDKTEVELYNGEKKTYKEIVKTSVAEGTKVYNGENYPSFPIVPLYANTNRQSELIGGREAIDCYDLIKNGFANDLDDASQIYWILKNTGGMKDTDLVKFIEHMKTVKAAAVDGDEGATAEAHTLEVPYQARETYLARLEKDLYRDFMALDTEKIAAGQVTATQIEAAYEALDERAFELSNCITTFIEGILKLVGVQDTPTFNPHRIVNMKEATEMVLLSAEYLDSDTVLKKLPFVTDAEREEIQNNVIREDANRLELEVEDE